MSLCTGRGGSARLQFDQRNAVFFRFGRVRPGLGRETVRRRDVFGDDLPELRGERWITSLCGAQASRLCLTAFGSGGVARFGGSFSRGKGGVAELARSLALSREQRRWWGWLRCCSRWLRTRSGRCNSCR